MPIDPLKPRTRAAFTLVEMSIVMVMIALLVGGVVAARELIVQFELRRAISQIEDFKAAITSFKLKYGCAPGDCNRAMQLGLGQNGNGNAAISIYGQENDSFYVWAHLAAAGMIAGSYTGADDGSGTYYGFTAGVNVPHAAIGRSGGVMYGRSVNSNDRAWPDHWFVVGTRDNSAGYYREPLFKAPEALSIDTKIDNGRVRTGRVTGEIFNYGGCGAYLSDTYYTTSNYGCPLGFMYNLP